MSELYRRYDSISSLPKKQTCVPTRGSRGPALRSSTSERRLQNAPAHTQPSLPECLGDAITERLCSLDRQRNDLWIADDGIHSTYKAAFPYAISHFRDTASSLESPSFDEVRVTPFQRYRQQASASSSASERDPSHVPSTCNGPSRQSVSARISSS